MSKIVTYTTREKLPHHSPRRLDVRLEDGEFLTTYRTVSTRDDLEYRPVPVGPYMNANPSNVGLFDSIVYARKKVTPEEDLYEEIAVLKAYGRTLHHVGHKITGVGQDESGCFYVFSLKGKSYTIYSDNVDVKKLES